MINNGNVYFSCYQCLDLECLQAYASFIHGNRGVLSTWFAEQIREPCFGHEVNLFYFQTDRLDKLACEKSESQEKSRNTIEIPT